MNERILPWFNLKQISGIIFIIDTLRPSFVSHVSP